MFDSTTIYVLAVIFFATLIRSTLGFEEALVAGPLLALRVTVTVATPVIIVQDWRKIGVRSAAWLILFSMLGIPLGLLLLAYVNYHVVKVRLGTVIVSFSIYSLRSKTTFVLKHAHWLGLFVAGFCSGVLGGAYEMNGPPLAIYGSLRRWSPQRFRATLQGYFLIASLVGLIGYVAMGLWVPEVTRYLILSLPGVFAAIFLGRMLNHRLKGDGFFRYVYVGLIGIGSILIAQALPR